MRREASAFNWGYFQQFGPFLVLLQSLEGRATRQHFECQYSHCPDIPQGAAIPALCVFGREVLHRPYHLLTGDLGLPRIVTMSVSEVTQFDRSLHGCSFTLAIMTFSILTSACTMPLLCRYCRPFRSCLLTQSTYFSLKTVKRCFRAQSESSAYSSSKLRCVSLAQQWYSFMMFSWSDRERILISRMRSSWTYRAWARVTAFSARRRWVVSSWTSETKECAPTPMVRMRQKKKGLGEDGGRGGVSMGGGGGCFLDDCSSMSLYLSAQRGMERPLPLEPSHYLCITFKIQGVRANARVLWEGRGMEYIDIGVCLCGDGNVQLGSWMPFIQISLGQTMDPLVDLPTQSALTFPSGLTIPDSESPTESAQRFQQTLLFVRSLLGGWGMTFGALSFSPQNQSTLQCLMELAEQRRRELQLRSRSKEELSAMQFERDKYHSFLEQAKRALEEHAKRIGRLENENAELKAQLKKAETVGKKQREEERKVSGGLRAKNEHMLHELKKREQEMARLKDQLKKNEKVAFKNSFEVYHPLKNSVPPHETPLTSSISGTSHSDERFAFLLERNQRDLAMALQENSILKEKIGDVRQSLQQFRRWVDVQVFGEEQTHNPPYPLEHIMFGKDNLARQLDTLLQSIKDGIVQLREICRGKTPPKRKEEQDLMNFKRKISCREQPKTQKAARCSPVKPPQQNKQKTAKITLITRNKPQPTHNQNQTPRSSQQLPTKQLRSEPYSKMPHRQMKVSLTDLKKMSHNKTASLLCTPRAKHQALTERLSDELSEISSHDLSIVSHLSIEQVGKGTHGWQELYQEDE